MLRLIFSQFSIVLLLVTLTACVSGPQDVKMRYFWPPLPSEPKIEWIGVYANANDFSDGTSVVDKMLGVDAEIALDKPLYLSGDEEGRVIVGDLRAGGFLVFDFKKRAVSILGGSLLAGVISSPAGVAVDATDLIYAADAKSRKIHVVDKSDKPVKVLDLSGKLTSVGSMVIDRTLQRLIVPDPKGHKVGIFGLDGTHIFSFGTKGEGNGEFNLPLSAALDSKGNILIVDSLNARVQRFKPDGTWMSNIGTRGDSNADFGLIKGIALDSQDNIYISDAKWNRISVFNLDGQILITLGGTFSQRSGDRLRVGGFLTPHGLYIDKKDRIYVADTMNHRLQVFQYINDAYLRDHPISKETAAPKPIIRK